MLVPGLREQPATATAQRPHSDFDERERPNRAALLAIVGELQSEATRRVGLRLPLEQDWIADLQQYHGFYDADTETKLRLAKRSQLFINATRPKTRTIAARLKDILFPTNERNWKIQQTPVPELTQEAEKATQQLQQVQQQAAAAEAQAAAQGQPMPEQAKAALSAAVEYKKQLDARVQEGKRRADLMQREMDDQLTECNYQTVKRQQIDWACKLGTGVTKGPVTGERVRRGWKKRSEQPAGQQSMDQVGQEEYFLDVSQGEQPGYRIVDLWNFFPDMDVADIEDGNGVFERHLFNMKQLRALQHRSGFDQNAIRRLLQAGPNEQAPSYIADLRNIRGATTQVAGSIYQVWEYSGPLEPEQMRTLALASNNRAAYDSVAEADPLQETNAVVWFCNGEVLKFQIYPLDSGECMYSVYCLYKDDSSIFGYGMPRVIRDSQSSLNAAWRTMLDNAGISARPNLIVDTTQVAPGSGVYEVGGGNVWLATKGWSKENPPVQAINIPSMQGELANIITLSERFIDISSGIPMLAGGEQGTDVTKTAQGMALLMNSTNVVLREPVKNFDDDVTEPDLRRLYDHNMQFSRKEEIKGDYDVKATGSSVLLVRELQSQNLRMLALEFGGHPIYGPMLKNRDLLRELFKAMMIDADELMLSDEEIDAILEQQAAAAAEAAKTANIPLEVEKMRQEYQAIEFGNKIQLANMERDTKLQLAKMGRDTEMMKLAGTMNMSLDKIQAMLEKANLDNQHKERALAAEIAVEQQNAEKARAAGEEPGGSGGSVSL